MPEILHLIEFRDRDGIYAAWRWKPDEATSVTKWDQLVVRENQLCILMQSGKVEQTLSPGRYVLDSKNFPIITKFLYGLVYGSGTTPFIGDLYFLNTTQFNARRWGTASPVLIADELYGQIPITANGTISYAVKNAGVFLNKVIGTQDNISVADLDRIARDMIVAPVFVDAVVGLNKTKIQEVINSRVAIAKELETRTNTAMEEYGLNCSSIAINSIGTTPEYESIMADAALARAKANASAFGISRVAEAQTTAERNLRAVGSSYRDVSVADAMKTAAASGGGAGGLLGTLLVAQAAGATASGQNVPPQVAPSMQFYVSMNGAAVGPLAVQIIQQLIAAGSFGAASLVWRQGMAGWQPADTVPELAGLFTPVATLPPPLPPL
jgi:membrane protease subunit (stomatin/prohibitin family)